ncbi:DUF2306 domain-containing protein [Silanimonas sp.]|uniref:DUF2306 domain-containing protein n=1 Tax=Silanimonas sp. TaxID=1929290 RepID=UPI0022BB37EE|nr:DUF2306 domain-containing protein [Silanimonas sp.]MCZ8113391.1 DUF2306 domain-containing protein [Silanimonas sp.]
MPDPTLATAVRTWFLTALVGQLAFVVYIVGVFLPPLWHRDPLAMNNKPHITGWVLGDTMGNAQLLTHVLLGALVTASGLVQLLPEVRRRWPALHRWNGRAFMLAALIATLSGFYLTWVRGSQLNLPSALATSANGLLIVVFVALAWRSALRRDIAAHREHALRAWVLVNGVWFLRIGLMLAGVSLAPFGVRMDVDGPLFLAVSVLSWAAPLALLQLYLWAGREASPAATRRVAWTFHGLTVLTAVGSLAAIVLLWAPRL